ncbi:hypothetical protein F7725_005549 [Dissostichus mawsoni]|uniref:Uncharacterized protein n=1 Tax=Dissostichus mawsoni TaxID=36200 RepID=A0A7J5YRK7_DISMA|nr:hypothetical protein F7725_005549 [Dissostichus mawsoni]
MRQAECLNLPPPTILDQETGFCPDDSPSIETATTHLTNSMNDMGSEVSKTLERIMNSDADLQNLLNTIRSSMAGLKKKLTSSEMSCHAYTMKRPSKEMSIK